MRYKYLHYILFEGKSDLLYGEIEIVALISIFLTFKQIGLVCICYTEQITDYMGWSYLGNFLMDNECIMLFYDESGWNTVKILTGYDLVNILGESFAFEFYVVDNRLTYLLCFSHEDQLIGAGRAKEWISKLENTKYGRR